MISELRSEGKTSFKKCSFIIGAVLPYCIDSKGEILVGVSKNKDSCWHLPRCTFSIGDADKIEDFCSPVEGLESDVLKFEVLLALTHSGNILPPGAPHGEFDYYCYTVAIPSDELHEDGKIKEECALDCIIQDEDIIFLQISDIGHAQTSVLAACLAELRSYLDLKRIGS